MSRLSATLFAVLMVAAITFVAISFAYAAELPTVSAGSDWSGIAILAVCVFLIVGAVLLHRRYPSQAAKADLAFKAEALKVFGEIRDHFKSAPAPAPAPSTGAPAAADAAPPPPAGKNGVAGVFSLPVTGDPAKDMPAINAAYFLP